MGISYTMLRTLSALRPDDFLLLAVALILLVENQCDRKFVLFVLLIFIMELPQGLLTR
ncbi:MAG: hypothetical protein ACM3TR_08165 [Caulobacteraceae bacterium]